jgi:CRP-like cAMP-binding protein
LLYQNVEMDNTLPCGLSPDGEAQTCMNCWVKRLSLMRDLSQEELRVANDERVFEQYQAGEVIFEEGTPSRGLFCLNYGKVKIVRSGLGDNDPIIALKKPVEFMGMKALFLEKNHSSSAIALEPCGICIIPRDGFLEIVKNNNDLSLKVVQLLSKELEAADKRMINLTQKHLRGRLADALLLLLDHFGTMDDEKTLAAQLKRADLAALANMTPANAIRILSEFTKEHILEVDRRNIKLLNLDKLKEISALG